MTPRFALRLCLALALATGVAGAQPSRQLQGAALLGQREAMSIGVVYHPKQWPRGPWGWCGGSGRGGR